MYKLFLFLVLASSAQPATVIFRQGVNGYQGTVDRVVGGAGGTTIGSVATPSDYLLRYAGTAKYHYLLRFDVSSIPAGATIQSATLSLTSGVVYTPGTVHVRALQDPQRLGNAYPVGWATNGPVNVETYRTGATAAYRDQSVTPPVQWTATGTSTGTDNVLAATLPDEAAAPVWNAGGTVYTYPVTQAVASWVSGAGPNQGWLVYADDTASIVKNHSAQDSVATARPMLTVTYTTDSTAGSTTPPPASTSTSATFQQGVSGYTGATDRIAGGPSGVATGAIASPESVLLRYSGTGRFNYLLRFDLSSLPAGATIQSATLTLKSGWVYTPANVHVRRLLDAGGLGAPYPLGWSNAGGANTTVYRTGATAAYRNGSVSPAVKWSASDAADNNTHVQDAAAPEESAVMWTGNETSYDFTVTQAVQSWVSGAPNEGWLVYADDTANLSKGHSVQDAVAANRPKLTVVYTTSGSPPPPPPTTQDTTAPAAITNLSISSCAQTSCSAIWSAPGNDGNTGTASSYDLRYSTAPITTSNWNSSQQVAGLPAPGPAATLQTATISGLTAGTTYYFAMTARDAAGNVSTLSNVATAATQAASSSGFVTYHPRLLINRDLNLAALKARAAGPLNADYNTLVRSIDFNWHLEWVSENTLISMVYGLSYLYQISGDVRYADKVIDNYLIGTSWASGYAEDNTPAYQLEAAAVAYDWLYDRLVARGLKDTLIAKLKSGYNVVANDNSFRTYIRESDFHNYTTEYEAAMLMTGLALYGDDPAADAMIQKGWGMIATGYQFSPTSYGDVFTYQLKASIDMTGGAMNWEGPGYWRNAAPQALRAIEAYDTASNRQNNVWPSLFSNTVNAGYYKLYTMRPDKTTPGLGDSDAGGLVTWKDNFGLVILMDRFRDGYLRSFIDQNGGAWYGGYGTGGVFKLLFYDSAVPAKALTDLPLSRQFGRDVVMRSGWGAGDTFLTFSAGYSGVYHNHLDDNSFTIFKNADLATDGGYSLASPYYTNYFKRTVAHNAITVFDPAECWRDTSTMSCDLSNDGGQRWTLRRFNPPFTSNIAEINRLWSGTLMSNPMYREMFVTATKTLDSGAGYDYIVSDATKAYTNQWSGQGLNTGNRVAKAIREFVYLRPDYVLVLDRVASTNAAFTKSWLLHSVNAPQLLQNGAWSTPPTGVSNYSASQFKVDNGAGRLFVKTLLPAGGNARTIGGPGYEAWVNGTNYGTTGLPVTAGQWRFEVKPASQSADDLFLHVLYPTTTSTAAMPATTLVDAGGMTGALIQDPTAPAVVMFSKSGAAQTAAAYSVSYTGTARHLLTGLGAGSYAVQQNGAPVGVYTASASGAISFQATGGGSFQITHQ